MRRYMVDPRIHRLLWGGSYLAAGFLLSAASLGQGMLPLASALVCACGG